MKFSMHNYALLLIMVLCFVSIGLPMSLTADLVSSDEVDAIDEINLNPGRDYLDMGSSNFKSVLSSQLSSPPRIYFVQTQSDSTPPEAQPESNLGQHSVPL